MRTERRQYDRGIEKKIKSMAPWLLNEIMHDDVGLRVPRDIDDRWYSGDRIEGVDFSLNDPVSVTNGPHTGKVGAVISLTGLLPEPEYLVELGDGAGDIRVPQSRLTPALQE